MVPPPARASARAWPLVGRDSELSLLSAAMDDASCLGVALRGPPGVGKTRLAREVVELASLRGLAAVSVRATRSSSDVPLIALIPLFASLGVDPTVENPAGAISAAVAGLAAVASRAGRHKGRPERGGQGGRVASKVAAGGTQAADAGAATPPRLVLVVDDVHELDEASTTVIGHLVASGGAFAVMTLRPGEQGPSGLRDLLADERVVQLEVAPLGAAGTAALVGAVLGGPVDAGTLQALWRQSGGNVLYLRELLQGALDSGALRSRRGIWHIEGSLAASTRLRDFIDSRLQGLSRAEREVLELAALAEPLEPAVLDLLAPADAIEKLEQQGLLDSVTGTGAQEVRLAHPLYGEVVRAHLSRTRRKRLCRSLAEVTEAEGPLRARDVLRVAVWRLDGGGGQPELLLRAAKLAYRDEEYALAIRLASAAWEGGGLVEAALLLGESIDVHGRSSDVERVLRAALPLASGDAERTAVTNGLASAIFQVPARADEADRLLLDMANDVSDPACRRALAAQRGDHFLRTGNVTRAIEIDRPLVAVPGDAAFVQASRDLGVALALVGRTDEALAYTEAALSARSLLEEIDHVAAAAVFLVAKAVALTEAGRLAEASGTAELGYAASAARGNRHGQAWFGVVLALARATEGRLATADRLFREASPIFEARGHPGARWCLGGIALAAGQMGDERSASTAVAELELLGPTTMHMFDAHIARGRAWAALASGDLASARGILAEAAELAIGWGQLSSAAAVFHDLLRMGGDTAAGRHLEELEGVVDGDLIAARILLARSLRLSDAALAGQAADAFESCGALLYAAEAATTEQRLAGASLLHRRATAAGARAKRLARRCEGARTPALAAPGVQADLSAREQEVALLAAGGLTSREIGERLFVSARTVDNHLQRIYLKLGVSGRGALAEHLARERGA